MRKPNHLSPKNGSHIFSLVQNGKSSGSRFEKRLRGRPLPQPSSSVRCVRGHYQKIQQPRGGKTKFGRVHLTFRNARSKNPLLPPYLRRARSYIYVRSLKIKTEERFDSQVVWQTTSNLLLKIPDGKQKTNRTQLQKLVFVDSSQKLGLSKFTKTWRFQFECLAHQTSEILAWKLPNFIYR